SIAGSTTTRSAKIGIASFLTDIVLVSLVLRCRLRGCAMRSRLLSTSRLEAWAPDEAARYRRRAIHDLQRQGGQPSRRRAVQDPRALREIELREVAWALEDRKSTRLNSSH